MIVLDASAAVELVLNLPRAAQVSRRIADPEISLHAPQLLPIEVLHVLRRRVATGATMPAKALEAIGYLEDLDLNYHDHLPFARRIWALRGNLTAYDAAYVALAEALPATLITSDRKLAGSPGHRARIEVVG